MDLVFTVSYHVTLEYDFWYSECFYPFCLLIYVFRVEKGLYKSPNEINIWSCQLLCSSFFDYGSQAH